MAMYTGTFIVTAPYLQRLGPSNLVWCNYLAAGPRRHTTATTTTNPVESCSAVIVALYITIASDTPPALFFPSVSMLLQPHTRHPMIRLRSLSLSLSLSSAGECTCGTAAVDKLGAGRKGNEGTFAQTRGGAHLPA